VTVPTAVAEDVTLDKWHPEYPDRLYAPPPRQQGQSRFVPIMPGTLPVADAGQGSDTGGLSAARLLQYVTTAGPVVVAVPADVTVEKWQGRYPAQHLRAKRALELACVVAPAAILEPVALSWAPQYPYPSVRPKPEPAWQSVAPLFVPDVTQAVPSRAWAPRYPDRVVRPTVLASSHQVLAWPTDTPVPPQQADAGQGSDQGALVKSVVLQYQPVAAPVSIASTAPAFDAALVPSGQAAVPVRRIYPRAVYTWGQQHFGVVVQVPVQSWLGNTPYANPVRRIARVSSSLLVAPIDPIAPPPETITLDKWNGTQPELVFRAKAPHSSSQRAYQADRFDAPDAVAVPALSWKTISPDRVWGLRPRTHEQYRLAVFVPDVTQPAVALAWSPRYPDRLNPPSALRAALQRAYQADTATTPGEVIVPALSWSPVYPARIWSKAQTRTGISVVPVYLADVTVLAPSLSWRPTYPDWIARVPALRAALQLAWQSDRFDAPDVDVTETIIVEARAVVRVIAARGVVRIIEARDVIREVNL
jgi:hypothetical protein